MKIIGPDYYLSFQCIAGECKHSCCKGWEIDIDAEKLQEYQSCSGEIGEKLRSNLVLTPDDEDAPAHFKLQGEEERCPFLNGENLCELILTLGEDALCQICTDHPRFRNYWSDFTEIGLGMACEEAARIILSKETKMQLVVLEDDGATSEPDWDEEDYLNLRDDLMEILQDRSFCVDERIIRMLEFCELDASGMEFYNGPLNETACEQLAVYLLYRNFADVIYDDRLEERVQFVAKSYCRVRNEWALNGKTDVESLIEPARKFSDEVEYDTDTW